MLTWSDEYVNDLAVKWYFLCINVAIQPCITSDQTLNELIEYGIKLKEILKSGSYTFIVPLNIFVDTDAYFDIWLDADGDIQASELYCDGTNRIFL
jgi:hypothetical protein